MLGAVLDAQIMDMKYVVVFCFVDNQAVFCTNTLQHKCKKDE